MANEMEQARQEHLAKYGSMLYCPERNTLCSFMDGMWMTGCERDGCILDDPNYQALKRKQEAIKEQRMEEERQQKAEERESEQIRNQTKMARSYIDRTLEEAHRMENLSQKAFHRNKPNLGHDYFNRAKHLRFEAYRYAKEHGIRL